MPIKYLPEPLQPGALRVRAFLMTDATAIIILGLGVFIRGLSYTPYGAGRPPSPGSHPAETFLPLHIWAVVWVAAGAACIVAAFLKNDTVKIAALAMGTSLNTLWGCSFLFSGFTEHGNPRAWVSSIGYFSIVALVMWAVWRGKRGDMPTDIERQAVSK